MAATDREPLTLDASTEEAASAPAGLAAVRLALAAGEEVRRFAGELGRAVPPAARVSEPLLAPLAAALWSLRSGEERRGLALLVADDDAARELAEAASWYLPGDDGVGFLPSRGVAYGSGLDPAPHLVGERARALELLARGGLVVVSADALAERVPPRDARPEPVDVALGQQHDRDALVARLVEAGYERRDAVDDRGQLAVRGDIVDVFPTTGQNPLRIELFGDEVERLSAFSLFTQRSLTTSDSATIYPAAERLVAAPTSRPGPRTARGRPCRAASCRCCPSSPPSPRWPPGSPAACARRSPSTWRRSGSSCLPTSAGAPTCASTTPRS